MPDKQPPGHEPTPSFVRREDIVRDTVSALLRMQHCQSVGNLYGRTVELGPTGQRQCQVIGDVMLTQLTLFPDTPFSRKLRRLLDENVKTPEDRHLMGLPDK